MLRPPGRRPSNWANCAEWASPASSSTATISAVTWRPPYRVVLGDAAKAGTNILEVTVINSWRNRVMADEKLPAAGRITRTNVSVQHGGRFQWHPEPSGLLGPVRIVAPAAR